MEEFRRSFDIGVLHSTEKWLLETYGGAVTVGGNFVRFGLQHILRSGKYLPLVDWFIRNGIKFLGYRLGRVYRWLPGSVCVCCSMHPLWWKRQMDLPDS